MYSNKKLKNEKVVFHTIPKSAPTSHVKERTKSEGEGQRHFRRESRTWKKTDCLSHLKQAGRNNKEHKS